MMTSAVNTKAIKRFITGKPPPPVFGANRKGPSLRSKSSFISAGNSGNTGTDGIDSAGGVHGDDFTRESVSCC